ncbi:phage tail tape measure protein [Paenibacillus tianjinensis]|uniref:Uncharacterized protein n=1 Tax=Paenibacillus tianjinensis TaxID=2810347 RepID=A0ABX7L5L3_9BACL|nr:hypothetical protein [Paenibacillus tianjinensis]QSF43395.1 hypothetical protein JRJ22_19200 [Paenibacillus tianjinensis]
MNKIIVDMLNDYGISLKDENGQSRDVKAIFNEISELWVNLNKEEQIEVLAALIEEQ